MQTKILPAENPTTLSHALDVLRHGGLVAFPTDTVYGLAAMPFQMESIERLYVVKGRSHTKAVAILLGNPADLEQVSPNPGPLALRLAQTFWPGPLTLIVPRHPTLPELLSKKPTIGVRVPNHPVALNLLRLTGPQAVTSANISGQASTRTAQEVFNQLQGRIHLIIDGGRTPGGVPSTVVDCTGERPVVLRAGPISLEKISAVIS